MRAAGVAAPSGKTLSRPWSSRQGAVRGTPATMSSHTGATWFRRGRFSGRAASRGPGGLV